MGFDIVRGNINKPQQTQLLVEGVTGYFTNTNDSGTLYLGFPLTASIDEKVTIDALLLSKQRGVVAIIFGEIGQSIQDMEDQQDKLYYHFEYYLRKYPSLRQGRHLAIKPKVITIVADKREELHSSNDYTYCTVEAICSTLEEMTSPDNSYYEALCEALLKVTNIRPKKKRSNITNQNSKGWIIREIEKEFANLDEWQKKAALEVPNGPQRIRGLAGTGKTIVLSLKAAYLHTQHPDWKILVTFYTRSLKQQYEDLIKRFVYEFSDDVPDWENLNILHAWGSQSEDGVYYRFARGCNAPVHTFSSAVSKYGRNKAFMGMCEELMEFAPMNASYETYDAILIDEAQDLPGSFFKIIYKLTKSPKRIIWAYDELQNLSDVEMPSISEMFGVDEDGNTIINIENVENAPKRDIVLPICYRNPPWTLAMAHALGFGIYNKIRNTPFQTFDNPEMWQQIGYSIVDGQLKYGYRVTIERSSAANPEYFSRLLDKQESIYTSSFRTSEEQYKWVAKQINDNIKNEELDPDDILVIFPEAYTSRSEYYKFSKYLGVYGVSSFLAGINSSQDTFKISGHVTCSGIFRAKGNESPMVYVVNSEYCLNGPEIVKQRNILFTAITRSRAWVRICGVGKLFNMLEEEFNECLNKDFKLAFKCPTEEEMLEIRNLNRERTKEELTKAAQAKIKIDELTALIEQEGFDPSMHPELEALMNALNRKRL